jgi:acetyl-CoA synthetase
VGEPLNPEAVIWGREVLGRPIHDNWWQTETGGIMIANVRGRRSAPGRWAGPLRVSRPPWERRTDGKVERVDDADRGGAPPPEGVALHVPGYLHQEERYRACFAGDWYLHRRPRPQDADGYFWFVGRADDVIKSSGHLIGPFEVESALLEHPAVAEAAVIGKPDPVAGEIVKAFVSLHGPAGATESSGSRSSGTRAPGSAPSVAPKEIEFMDDLPKTKSGKIMRRLLKARELGFPEGDLSTLEEPP